MLQPLIGIWQFVLIWAWGAFLERRMNLTLPYAMRMIIAFALGELTTSYFLFGLGLFGGLRLWVLLPIALIASALLLPRFSKEISKMLYNLQPVLALTPLASGVVCAMWVIYGLGTLVPEREVDALWYHLGTPLYYIHHGGFIQLVPFNMPSHYPGNAHLHYVFSLLFGNDTSAKVFTLLHFIPLQMAIWCAVQRYTGKEWGMYAIAFYMLCINFRLPVMANVQRPVFFYIFLSTYCLWIALEEKQKKVFLLAALFCGMAMGTKFNALLFAYSAQVSLMLIWFFILRKENVQQSIVYLLTHSAISWALLSPWMIKSWMLTGNPLYPLLGNIFPTREPFAAPMISNAGSHGINLLKADSLQAFFHEIWINFQWHLYNADLLLPLGLASLAILLFIRRSAWILPTISGLLTYGLFTMMWGADVARLFSASYSIGVVMIALVLSWFREKSRAGQWIAYVVLLSLFVTFMNQKLFYLSSDNIRWFGGIHVSEEARRNWLDERNLFSHELFAMRDWMHANIPPEDELYVYRLGYAPYLDRKYILSDVRFTEQMDIWLEKSPRYAAEQLQQLDVAWILCRENPIAADPDLQSAWELFKKEYLTLKHQEGNIKLYRFVYVQNAVQ